MTAEQHQILNRIAALYKRLNELGDTDPQRGCMLLGLIDVAEEVAFQLGVSRETIKAFVNREMMRNREMVQA